MNEREFIARLEAADTATLVQLLNRPDRDEERALRVHLGDALFERMHALARGQGAVRSIGAKQGNVVVLHGTMGGELTRTKDDGRPEPLWINMLRIVLGAMGYFRLDPDGQDLFTVRATGILKKYYGQLLLSLSTEWNTLAFWYDWRKPLDAAAVQLDSAIRERFGTNARVHLVAHSMGGLVARTFILRFAESWKRLWDEKGGGASGGRLIMLGTPNHGSFEIPQVMTGAKDIVRKLALLDTRHDLKELVAILNTFPGSYQMLPSPLEMPEMTPLYQAATYGAGNTVLQRHLDAARRHHDELHDVVDPDRMIYIAGFNQPTYCGLPDLASVGIRDKYRVTLRGDGTVPHRLGFLTKGSRAVDKYFVPCEHGNLPADQRVIDAVWQLLPSGECQLPTSIPDTIRGVVDDEAAARLLIAHETVREAGEESKLRGLSARLRARTTTAGPSRSGNLASSSAPPDPAMISDAFLSEDEREAEAMLLAGLLGDGISRPTGGALPAGPDTQPAAAAASVRSPSRPSLRRVEIALVSGRIEQLEKIHPVDGPPIDAISVGHYAGVKPQYAELSLDRVISEKLRGNSRSGALDEIDLLVTQLTLGGIIRGELGALFFLDDPRRPGRVITIAGMGSPGRFGGPELSVLSNAICWSLGRCRKRHLATVVIGSGAGNLPLSVAMRAWIQGIRRAALGSNTDESRLERISFIESDVERIEELDRVLSSECVSAPPEGKTASDEPAVELIYRPLTPARIQALREQALQQRRREWTQRRQEMERAGARAGRAAATADPIPVRMTVELDRQTLRYSAITGTASIPQREVPANPVLFGNINDDAASAQDNDRRWRMGRLLERLLMPRDFTDIIYTNAPLVMMLDATTARIHWELLARRESNSLGSVAAFANSPTDGAANEQVFLGLRYGVTRQLRTTFAPPPELPQPPQRRLRVLIVADPARDAPLPGAIEEGEAVEQCFKEFSRRNESSPGLRIEITSLIGPLRATMTNVLETLFNDDPYDVLHFAGHCVFDVDDPAGSGWIFSDRQRLSAREFNRVDRVPRFIFSNACQSGVTPDRSDQRDAALAPSFAEAFFARGVTNFVCTAWPVGDEAARKFADRLYSGLLGLTTTGEYEPMCRAMQAGRASILNEGNGRSWAAYQHYGEPFFRFVGKHDAGGRPPAPEKVSRRRSRLRPHPPGHNERSGEKPGLQPRNDTINPFVS